MGSRLSDSSSLVRSGERCVSTPTKLLGNSSSPQLLGPERFFYDKSTFTGIHAQGSPANNGTYPTLLSSLSSTNRTCGKATESGAGGDERVRMECPYCGYKCFPQWLNDEAHCLKCQAVLRKRPSCIEKSSQRRASTPGKLCGNSSTRPASRSGQRRASTPARLEDSSASRKMVGPERFFYDKSTYTGAHAHGGPR